MKLKKGSAAAKAYMAKIRAAKGKKTTAKKVGATLLIEKNETQFTKPKKIYKINRNANGRIKNYDKIEIQQKSINKKEKFFYKSEFDEKTNKNVFVKYLIAETFFSNNILLYRAKGDRSFTEANTGLAWPMDLYNLVDFKKEMRKGENGAFGKRLKDAHNIIESQIKRNGKAPF